MPREHCQSTRLRLRLSVSSFLGKRRQPVSHEQGRLDIVQERVGQEIPASQVREKTQDKIENGHDDDDVGRNRRSDRGLQENAPAFGQGHITSKEFRIGEFLCQLPLIKMPRCTDTYDKHIVQFDMFTAGGVASIETADVGLVAEEIIKSLGPDACVGKSH